MATLKVVKTVNFDEDGRVEQLAEVPVEGNQTVEPSKKPGVIGKPVNRKDAYVKVTGTATYTFDKTLPHLTHAKILRSPYPHARIRNINTSRAESLPGVLAVITHKNTPQIPWYNGSFLFDTHLRYAGDEIACVAAETEKIAEAALALIEVDCEVLPFVVDPVKAQGPQAPQFHEEGKITGGKPDEYERGNPEAGEAESDVIVNDNFTTQVVVHNQSEPHCSVVTWKGNRLTVWDSTQAVYRVRNTIAEKLGMPESHVRVLSPYMGGGFGGKLELGKHTMMAALLARNIGRPVRISLNRREMNLAVGNRPDSVQSLKAGAKKDGTLTLLSEEMYGSSGAYSYGAGCKWPLLTMYKCDNVKYTGYYSFTNLGRACALRAPMHVQGTFSLDSILDEVAEEIGMDPLDFRLKNYAEMDQVYQIPYTSKKLREAYELGAERFGWKRKFKPAGTDTGRLKCGVGLASQIWWGGGGPPAGATLKLNRDGSLRIIAGTQDLGTGTRTILAQTAAEVLEIPVDSIEVSIGDTESGPYCPLSGGSMTAASVTPAVQDAALQIREALLTGAAETLEMNTSDLLYREGVFQTKADESKKLSISEIITQLRERTIVRTGYRAANLEGHIIQSFGVQFAEVEVDTFTGKVRVIRIVAAHDIGRTLNRKLLENQFEGGIIQGISYALLEERVVDEKTGRVLTTNLLDYKISTILETPEIEVITVPNIDLKANSTGVKGVGEPPIIPTAGAIANAVYNAIGIRIKSLPITPDKVLMALKSRTS